jgi:hypothetical protein
VYDVMLKPLLEESLVTRIRGAIEGNLSAARPGE